MLRVHAPFTLRNLFPRSLQYQVRQANRIVARGLLAAGVEAPLHSVVVSSTVAPAEYAFKLEGFEWSVFLPLPTAFEASNAAIAGGMGDAGSDDEDADDSMTSSAASGSSNSVRAHEATAGSAAQVQRRRRAAAIAKAARGATCSDQDRDLQHDAQALTTISHGRCRVQDHRFRSG